MQALYLLLDGQRVSMSEGQKIIRQHFFFYGHVQGVGFRYRAMHAAQSCGVTGYVRNRWDGSVEMEAEGTEEAIDRTIQMIERGRWIGIDRMVRCEIPPEGSRSFEYRDDAW